ncbi:MAG: HTH-type transcriptional regulator HdfR [Gammaproteobacteria bacterium]|nr:HTH-type transcriptional regulator HdfR [Gammaproteobacteria bacterium]MBU1555082.1 HTH-type transcriptional regulator HdfR [Gammaproteobacteria bacterium]MBU2071788.1 HTH-type transcriptional regulator HdfR [Gammaproteobacteria bacterium]MBU2184144.1 HTH-type transcriptional regulator HdfR [Gammaproteobacteria bacterium]MBU2204297.1 HTH-type transcriptional regulator HdfR [Gammaproteobacteria bacterium]
MDTELLKTFIEVQRTRHFGKAAENLYLTQSAVSFRIRQLEQQLGVNLFSRYRNNIQLTAAGERLLPHAEAMLTALQRAKQDVAVSAEQAVQLSIAATANIWDAFLLQGFISVQQALPGLSWRAESLGREQIARLVLERHLDLAVLFDAPKVDEMQIDKLGDIQLLPVTTHSDRTVQRAMQQQYILVDWGTAFDIQHARHFPELPPPQLRTGSARIALELMQQRGGSAYLPQTMVKPLLDDGSLHLITDAPVMQRELFAVSLPKAAHRVKIADIITQLRALLSANK